MEGESSLSPAQIWKYDVFLSFMGTDTGNNFAAHLLAALKSKGIYTFIADQKSETEIVEAIAQSQISIVVLSRNHAASIRCLDELVNIIEYHESAGLTVWPVFYDVKPHEVRRLIGDCGRTFAEQEGRFRNEKDKLERWRMAIMSVANLMGWTVQDKLEAEVIDNIVKRAINVLSHKCLSVADDLVGIESRVNTLGMLLDVGSEAVQFVGIYGMGGTGKTTLASVMYHRIFPQFEACCFLANVSEFSKTDGLTALQEQLLRATLEWKDLDICNVYEGSVWIHKTLQFSKTLLVLDNVDDLKQLETLARYPDWFGAGSVIIITTRDQSILKRFGIEKIYEIGFFSKDEALQLFCRSAFKCDHPMKGYEELSCTVLEYARGLPFAIKSLGSYLHHRSVSEWKSALAKIKMLRESFDEMSNENEIVLEIARFFVGEKNNYEKEISSHHQKTLLDKSLMTTSDQRNHIHDMLRQIIQQEPSEEQRRKSKLWLYDDFRDLREINTATTDVEGIILNQEDLEEAQLSAEVFSKTINLRLLMIQDVKISGNLEYLSNELVYLSWYKYSFTSLPPGFEPHGLVELIMPESSITHLWEGIKMLPKLRSLNLRGSKNLIKTPDFRGVLNLEMLDLEGCTGLLQLHPSIAILPKLTFLNLKNCTSLVSIPNNLSAINSLKTLNLDGCSIQMKLLSNQHCPFFLKMLCFLLLSFLKGIKNNKLVLCCLICLICKKSPPYLSHFFRKCWSMIKASQCKMMVMKILDYTSYVKII